MSEPEDRTLGTLAHQSLRRALTSAESLLAHALEEFFATGNHEFPAAVEALQQRHIPRPSGSTEPWTVAALESELKLINDSLDEAYQRRDGVRTGG
jgi:Recombinase-like helix-turn-helix domain